MNVPVTVLIPVGPNYNSEWLHEAINSVKAQIYSHIDINIILDGRFTFDIWEYFEAGEFKEQRHHIDWTGESHYYGSTLSAPSVYLYRIPANIGFVAAFNIGMSLARNELAMYLASDDKMLPDAVEKAVATWEKNNRKDAWYCCSYIDSDGNTCAIQNNLALTTKHFFLDMCGGYPPAAFVGPDAALLSCLMVHAPDRIIKVEEGTPLYWIRNHDQQETKIHTWKYVPEMNSIRNKLTLDFKFKNE